MTTPHQGFSAGIHAVYELCQHAPESIKSIIILSETPGKRIEQCLQIAQDKGLPIQTECPAHLQHLLKRVRHQDIIAIHHKKLSQPNDLWHCVDKWGPKLRLVILDGVQDPRNLGACIRTACAGHCHGLVIPKQHNASVNETATKVACGACAILPIFPVTNIARTISKLKEKGVWCWGFSEHAKDSLFSSHFHGATALIFGNEATGLRSLTTQYCDHLIAIPTQANFPSLNLSVSVGISVFELYRQQQLAADR